MRSRPEFRSEDSGARSHGPSGSSCWSPIVGRCANTPPATVTSLAAATPGGVRMKRAILMVLLLAFVASSAVAAVPPQISYQGVLTDPLGDLVPDATHTFTFSI